MSSDVELASYPCQQVVGEGALCMEPCDPGFVRCSVHRQYSDKRALGHKLEMAQDRVLRKVESKIDEAVDAMIDIAVNGTQEASKLRAIENMLRLTGFVDLKIDMSTGAPIDPVDRDKVLLQLIQKHVKDESKLAQLQQKVMERDTDIIDAEVIENDHDSGADA